MVSVRQTEGPQKLAEKDWDRLSRIYLIVKTAPNGGASAELPQAAPSSSLEASELTRAWTHTELWGLIHRAEKLAATRWSGVVAAQTYSSDDLPAAAATFQPTGTLVLEPTSLRVHQEPVGETVDTRTQRAQFKYGARIEGVLAWRFYGEPGHVLLEQGRYPDHDTTLSSDEPAHKIRDLDAYLKDKLPRLFGEMLAPLKEQVLPHGIDRWRTVQTAPGPLKEAAKLAKDGDWDAAEAIWKAQAKADAKDWKAAYDLGIYAEHKGRWEEARKQYTLASALAPQGSASPPKQTLSELDDLMPKAQAAQSLAPPPLMTGKIALLPFTNGTNFPPAPESLRSKVFAVLQEGGYTLLPPEKTDAALKATGKQSDLMLPSELAAATSAEFLLSGDALKFEAANINGGFISQVALRLEIIDPKGASVWKGDAGTTAQSNSDPKTAGQSFLQKFVGDQADPTNPDFLKDQAQDTVLRALGSLPQAPPPEKP